MRKYVLSLRKREAWGIRDVEPPASRPRARKTWRFPSKAVGFQVLSFIFLNQGLYTVWTQPVVQGGLFFFFFLLTSVHFTADSISLPGSSKYELVYGGWNFFLRV